VVAIKGVAGVAALDAAVWVAPQNNATTNGDEIAHMKASAAGTDTLAVPNGIAVESGQYLLVNFVDTDANHEVWIYFD